VPRLRLAVLISGRGSNMESLLKASRAGTLDADVVLVASNKPDAGGLDVARKAGVPTFVSVSKGRKQDEHEAELVPAIDAARPDLVLLAGYMRIVTPAFVRHYEGRLLNIHPSLLPAFPGLDAVRRAVEHGVRVTGCTVHFVDEDLDSGPIIRQAAVEVKDDDTVDTLSARILQQEHRIYSEAIAIVLAGRYRIEGRRVILG